MRIVLIIILLFLMSSASYAEKVEVEKSDYIKLIVSSYVNGFNEFNTSVTTLNSGVLVGIYYDISTQNVERANQLAKRFRTQLPFMFEKYEWAKNIRIVVDVYSHDWTGGGY